MANEKSRNHETGGGKGGASKHQGKPDDQDHGDAKSASTQDSAKKSPAAGATGTKGASNDSP